MKKTDVRDLDRKQLNKPKISVQECKIILNKNGENFSDEQVKEIREFLYALIEIDYNNFQKHMKAKADQLMAKNESEEQGKIIQLKEIEISDENEFRQAG